MKRGKLTCCIRFFRSTFNVTYLNVFFSAGQYCIYKKRTCPPDLESGYVYWDDEDFDNRNDKRGILPTGEYGKDTKIYFCCATSGNKTDPIIIPAKDPFFLLAYGSKKCQMVKWAVASVERIRYHTEDRNNEDKSYGAYPYNAGTKNPTIYYCYYRGEQSHSCKHLSAIIIAFELAMNSEGLYFLLQI